MRRIGAILAGVVIGAVLTNGCGGTPTGLDIGLTAPEFRGEDVNGRPIRLADHRGKVIVLDFWATWCAPCRAMIPHERELSERLRDKPFVILGVSMDHDRVKLGRFLESQRMTWPNAIAGDQAGVGEEWAIGGLPTVYVIDPKGVIRHKFVGKPDDAELDEAVNGLLREAGVP